VWGTKSTNSILLVPCTVAIIIHIHVACFVCIYWCTWITKSAAAKIIVDDTAQVSGITVTINTHREMLVMTFVGLNIVYVHIMCHVVCNDASL
jgi:hypothetical protein